MTRRALTAITTGLSVLVVALCLLIVACCWMPLPSDTGRAERQHYTAIERGVLWVRYTWDGCEQIYPGRCAAAVLLPVFAGLWLVTRIPDKARV